MNAQRITGLLRPLGALVLVWGMSMGSARADHFSGVSLTYESLGGNFYRIILELYLDCSGTPVTPQTLRFKSTCGTEFQITGLTPNLSQEVSPLCPAQVANSTCNGGWLPSYRRHRFEVPVFLATCNGTWNVNWFVCCRNTLVNVINEPGTYAELTLNNWLAPNDNSPQFPITTIPYVCVNEPFSFNPGASDVDGNPFTYSLISARFGAPTPFSVTYAPGFSATQPIQGLSFDGSSGQISGTPTQVGNYVVVFRVNSLDMFGNVIGTVMRDLMFIVYVCDDSPPVSSGISNVTPGVVVGPNSAGPCNGFSFCLDVVFSDANPDSEIEIFSDAQTVLPGSTLTVSGTNPAVATFCWTANTSLLPANIFLYATDGACPIENVASRAIYINDCVILPIELISFTARREGAAVKVAWSTVAESNNDFFSVERSADGKHYERIGTVKAAGNSQGRVDYGFVDADPTEGVSFYRLRQTDMDGRYSFSEVVQVEFVRSQRLVAIADGADGWMVERVPFESEWQLVDMLGRTVAQGSLADEGSLRIPMTGLAGAMHMLVVRSGTDRQQVLRLPALGAGVAGITVTSLP